MNTPIDSATLGEMKDAYLAHPARLKVSTGEDLKGFRLNVDSLLEVISQPNMTDVFVVFGVRPEDLGKPQDEQFFTLAYAGIDSDNNLRTELIYDYCEPCPDRCPAGY